MGTANDNISEIDKVGLCIRVYTMLQTDGYMIVPCKEQFVRSIWLTMKKSDIIFRGDLEAILDRYFLTEIEGKNYITRSPDYAELNKIFDIYLKIVYAVFRYAIPENECKVITIFSAVLKLAVDAEKGIGDECYSEFSEIYNLTDRDNPLSDSQWQEVLEKFCRGRFWVFSGGKDMPMVSDVLTTLRNILEYRARDNDYFDTEVIKDYDT